MAQWGMCHEQLVRQGVLVRGREPARRQVVEGGGLLEEFRTELRGRVSRGACLGSKGNGSDEMKSELDLLESVVHKLMGRHNEADGLLQAFKLNL